MEESYDILFAGGIVDGFDINDVRDNVARLFKANEQTLTKLFSGKPQMIKRGIDKPAAIKYKAAMQKAGAVALVRAHKPASAPTPAAAATKATKAPAAEKPLSMAERLAALTGDTEPDGEAAKPAFGSEALEAETPSSAAATAELDAGSMSLAPAGSDVLREDERTEFEELDIDTSAINLMPEFSAPAPSTDSAPPAPDVSHLSMGDVGETIPHLESEEAELNPDTSHLSMGDVGEAIPKLVEEKEAVSVDTSALDLAPEGSDVLDAQYRKSSDAAPPSTDHLSLES
ncbi:MAG: hypothetical protein AAGI24_17110 [Pseudomonadota bacterium]